jgi:hypothetical protein
MSLFVRDSFFNAGLSTEAGLFGNLDLLHHPEIGMCDLLTAGGRDRLHASMSPEFQPG